jgi:signal transduction histidine kinase
MTETSPRTQTEPMAFTRTEFWRGATSAWLWFIPLSLAPWTIFFGPYAVIAAMYVVPWSIGAALVFATPAYLLGRALRRIPRMPVHLLAFASLGAAVGVATTVVLFAVDPSLGQAMGAAILTVNTAASTAAVTIGWWRSARRALRSDVVPVETRGADTDAAAEDALLGDGGSAR